MHSETISILFVVCVVPRDLTGRESYGHFFALFGCAAICAVDAFVWHLGLLRVEQFHSKRSFEAVCRVDVYM